MGEESATAPVLEPEELVEVGAYPSAADGFERGLVVLAMRQPYWLDTAGGGARLLVEPAVAEAARQELASYERENARWRARPRAEHAKAAPGDVLTPMLWSILVLALFRAQVEWPALTAAGALDSQAVVADGEWWRSLSALFLHADAPHVISNALSGLAVFVAVVGTFGIVRGWLLSVLSGAMANLALAVATAVPGHRSVGASTMIFAGLGLLTGRAMRAAFGEKRPGRWRGVFVPFAAGATILGLYGAGGIRVDVGAHLAGFAVGGIVGFCVRRR